MKSFLFIAAIFILSPMVPYAQSIEFAPKGSVWTYIQVPPGDVLAAVQYVDNILVDTILCKRFTTLEGDYYVYQVGDRVYHRRDTASQFTLLWDFGVMPGDSFFVYLNNPNTPDKKRKVVCTGRDTIVENNVSLPRIDLTLICNGESSYSITVNPRYGPMYKEDCPKYLFNNYCGFDAYAGFALSSYNDSEFPSVKNCPTIVDTTYIPSMLNLFPNPTTGLVYLVDLPDGADFECYDTFGRLVTVQPDDVRNSIDLSGYPAGIYFVNIRLNDRVIKQEKLIKI